MLHLTCKGVDTHIWAQVEDNGFYHLPSGTDPGCGKQSKHQLGSGQSTLWKAFVGAAALMILVAVTSYEPLLAGPTLANCCKDV